MKLISRHPRTVFYLLGVLSVPTLYLAIYIFLRLTGVYYSYYSQGSWEVEGGTDIYLVDLAYLPMAILENETQIPMKWLPEPTGG